MLLLLKQEPKCLRFLSIIQSFLDSGVLLYAYTQSVVIKKSYQSSLIPYNDNEILSETTTPMKPQYYHHISQVANQWAIGFTYTLSGHTNSFEMKKEYQDVLQCDAIITKSIFSQIFTEDTP